MSVIFLLCKSARDRLGWIRDNGGSQAKVIPVMSGTMPAIHTTLGLTYHVLQTVAFAACPDTDVLDWAAALSNKATREYTILVDSREFVVTDFDVRLGSDNGDAKPVVEPYCDGTCVFGSFMQKGADMRTHFVAAGLAPTMNDRYTFILGGPVVLLSESEVAGHG